MKTFVFITLAVLGLALGTAARAAPSQAYSFSQPTPNAGNGS